MSAFDEELLSAYLDGELTAGERAHVEQWLEEEPQSRQLLEDLRAVKTSLERVPRRRLPADFAEQVLRRAERHVLTSGGDGAAASGNLERARPGDAETGSAFQGLSWQRMRRPLIWATLSLAAGLLIMVVERHRAAPRANREVAMAPEEARRQEPPEISAPAGGMASGPRRARERLGRGVEGPPAPAPAAAAPAADDPTTTASTPAAPDAAPGKELPSQMARQAGVGDRMLVVLCDVAPDTDYQERFRELLASNSISWQENEEVTDEADAPGAPRGEKPTRKQERRSESAGAAPAARRALDKSELKDETSEFADLGLKRNLAEVRLAVLDPQAELVLVEASEPQIEAVLTGLDRDAEIFKTVDVEPAADAPRQQQLQRRYGRPAPPLRHMAGDRRTPSDEEQMTEEPKKTDTPPALAAESKSGAKDGLAYRVRSRAAPLGGEEDQRRAGGVRFGARGPEQNRMQVLFVLRPLQDALPVPAAPAAEETNRPND